MMKSRTLNKALQLLPKLNDLEIIRNSLLISTLSISSINSNQPLFPNRSKFNLIQSGNEELDTTIKRFQIQYNNDFNSNFIKLNKRGFFGTGLLDPVSKKYNERKLIG